MKKQHARGRNPFPRHAKVPKQKRRIIRSAGKAAVKGGKVKILMFLVVIMAT